MARAALTRTAPGTAAAAPGARQRGFSMPEMIVVLLLLSVISLIFYGVYVGTMRASMFLESHNDLAIHGQRVANQMRREIVQSRLIYQNDTVGNAYIAALSLPTGANIETDAKLPTINPNGSFEADPDASGNEHAGNMLFIVRQLVPLELTVDHDGDATNTADLDGDGTVDPPTPEIAMLTDLYRFKLYYPTENIERGFRPYPYYLDLFEYESPIYADYFQLSGLAPGGRTDLAQKLFAQGITRAWDPGQPVASALYDIDSAGNVTAAPSVSGTPAIARESCRSVFPQFRGGSVSGTISYSMAIQADPPLQELDPVPLFAVASGKYPGGFEVLVIGPTGGRKVLARLVLLAGYQDKVNSVATSVTAATAEF